MKLLLAAAIITLCLTGCIDEEAARREAAVATEESFSAPEQVGVLPDGRAVMVITHVQPLEHDRHIYFVAAGGVTINRDVPVGKSTRQVTTFIAPTVDQQATDAAIQEARQAENRRIAVEKLETARILKEEAEALLTQ